MRTGIKHRMRNTTRLAFLCGALALIFFATSASGQTPSPTPSPQQKAVTPAAAAPQPSQTPPESETADDEGGEVIRVSSNLVVVPVSVTDAKGQPVMGLAVKDFRLEEEGRVQEIAQIRDPEP